MRTQYCRIKIVEGDAGEKCDVSPDTISDLKKVLKFVEDHPDLSGLATGAIKPLMRIPDPQERETAISSVSKALKSKKNPNTGKFTKRVTKTDILKTMEKIAPSAIPPASVVPVVEAPVEPTPASVIIPPLPAGAPMKDVLARDEIILAGALKSNLPPQASLGASMQRPMDLPGPITPVDPAKAKRERMEELASELLTLYPPDIQTAAVEIMRYHPSYKVKDVFYFGVVALSEKKK